MALRTLMLRKSLTDAQNRLAALQQTRDGFVAREEELAAAIEEANTPEERSVVEEQVTAFETEQRENTEAIAAAEEEIRGIEEKIQQAEAAAAEARSRNPGAQTAGREERTTMPNTTEQRTNFFNMTVSQRAAFFAQDEVKSFIQQVRELGGQKRAVAGVELTIPDNVLGLLRDNMTRYSKILRYVNVKSVKGSARATVLGTIPEAVWTEQVGATLNELSFSFHEVEVDGYRIGGYIPIDNAYLEDSDIALGTEIITMLGQAIGLGVDKAIIYGTGTKMPVGIVTRLKATTAPAWWGDKAGEFTNLSTTHILKLDLAGKSGVEFFAALISALGAADPKYSNGQTVWFMNRTTRLSLMAKAIEFNASAALVSSVNATMPVIGGDIVELDFIPDGDIIGGYGSLYLMVERAGAKFGYSDIPFYLQEKTVFKGSARYDGKPVRGEAFVAVSILNAAVTTEVTFAPDKANEAAATSEEE